MALAGYTYRKQLTITGTADGAKNPYQLKLSVNRSSGSDSGLTVYLDTKCNVDFSDIRFTQSDGDTKLDYWIESVSGTVATVWVEFVSIPASPNTIDFYIYYGDADAASETNGTNTFPFFDDFSGDLSKWDVVNTASIAGGICTVSSGADDSKITSKTTFSLGYSIISYAKSAVNGSYSFHAQFDAGADYARMGQNTGLSAANFSYETIETANSNGSLAVASDTNYHLFELERVSTTLERFYIDNSLKKTVTSATNIPNDTVGAGVRGINKQVLVDWFFVRYCTITDPTISAWGDEENLVLANPTVTTQAATNVTATTATLNGNITATGGFNATRRGFQYGTVSGALTEDTHEDGDFGTGAFSLPITGL